MYFKKKLAVMPVMPVMQGMRLASDGEKRRLMRKGNLFFNQMVV